MNQKTILIQPGARIFFKDIYYNYISVKRECEIKTLEFVERACETSKKLKHWNKLTAQVKQITKKKL